MYSSEGVWPPTVTLNTRADAEQLHTYKDAAELRYAAGCLTVNRLKCKVCRQSNACCSSISCLLTKQAPYVPVCRDRLDYRLQPDCSLLLLNSTQPSLTQVLRLQGHSAALLKPLVSVLFRSRLLAPLVYIMFSCSSPGRATLGHAREGDSRGSGALYRLPLRVSKSAG